MQRINGEKPSQIVTDLDKVTIENLHIDSEEDGKYRFYFTVKDKTEITGPVTRQIRVHIATAGMPMLEFMKVWQTLYVALVKTVACSRDERIELTLHRPAEGPTILLPPERGVVT